MHYKNGIPQTLKPIVPPKEYISTDAEDKNGCCSLPFYKPKEKPAKIEKKPAPLAPVEVPKPVKAEPLLLKPEEDMANPPPLMRLSRASNVTDQGEYVQDEKGIWVPAKNNKNKECVIF